jgi:predicted amidohydrolase
MIKAGFIQFRPELGNQDANIKKLKNLIPAAKDADLIVLPELANSGYNFISKEHAFENAEEAENSRFTDFLAGEARKYNLNIVAGINERENGKLYNSAVLVTPEGISGKYRKIHLFWNEKDIFEKGNLGLPVFDLGFCKIGILICFDWIFPEVWRILALKGADIICHPSNLVLPYAQQAVPVHGMINKTFNITANRYGTERDVTFSGKSIISDPTGKTMITAAPDKDEAGIVEMDIEKAREKMITPRNHVFNDRIPEEYSQLIS